MDLLLSPLQITLRVPFSFKYYVQKLIEESSKKILIFLLEFVTITENRKVDDQNYYRHPSTFDTGSYYYTSMPVCFKPYNVAELNRTLILKNILKFAAIYWLSCAILGALYGIICALIV